MSDAAEHSSQRSTTGLSLAPMRGLRPTVGVDRLGRLLCPPYDVIDHARRAELLATDADNAVSVVLPDPTSSGYEAAARRLDGWVEQGLLRVDDDPALYVYEMREADGHVTRGLLGAVELRDPADGVILPHENTMAGPVADRLAVMTSTETDLEPIYLVYDGGGRASELVAAVDAEEPVATAVTPDGITHRLWSVTDPAAHRRVADDLGTRRALIADGHHRYATYRERQRLRRATDGAGVWDRGLALLVDTTEHGPQVHPIHRTLAGVSLEQFTAQLAGWGDMTPVDDPVTALSGLADRTGFAAVITDGVRGILLTDPTGRLAEAAARDGDDPGLTALDVTVLHRGVVEQALGLVDDVHTVGYAHDVAEAVTHATANAGVAVLLRPTPVAAVAAVAAAGARMPRKSTLFTPKPASGLVMRRLRDQT
ncbi:Uncharacterized conserved protein, DUF1015 family [Jatrophihabitans endophyticus]|uniref:Uncharacterized conserved protein, DUF1015 family n=1 Tax=Jatrophihabitans endophyticus TaxID=1206085 RepID=A0A1M5MP18_9ACTN|nr:DUF1015 domain-containing protein [Jatrophihabitans endophyticus]SHG78937.1 Uncharacterized conserved protein, DUF1015 family [Jatrophihabitans endophyticus]